MVIFTLYLLAHVGAVSAPPLVINSLAILSISDSINVYESGKNTGANIERYKTFRKVKEGGK